ncbi:MAG TPA: class I adenylate-forming enzyme family protein [Terriglobales bacterium]|nr:class I adenylate-forming enzyme family protein [Terriglobales bacterium]
MTMTIREQILDVVDKDRDRTFLVDAHTGREVTYGEFHELACALSAELHRRGLRRGDRLGVMAPNSCELAVVYFACLYAGATIVPINPNLSAGDVRFILSSCAPRMVVTSPSLADRVRGAGNETEVLVLSAAPGDSAAGALDISRLPRGERPGEFRPMEESTAEDLMVIVYTSGTTAKPKGLAHRTGRMFRNARAFASQQGIDQTARFYLTLSMAYMGGFYNLLLLPFLHGSSVIIDNVFDARSSLVFWDRASRYQANTLWLAPTVMSILIKMDRGQAGERFCREHVSRCFVGFAPLPQKLKESFEARYGVRLIENYGLSETLFVTARSRADFSGAGYVGEALPGIKLRAVAEDGSLRSAGSDGEIQVLSPDLMAGYLDQTGNLNEVNADDWFSTGDFGRLGEQGGLLVTGRKKDIIIRGGVNISPAAIEEALLHSPGVVDVAVVSIPHELYGEDIVAVLKLEPGIELGTILEAVMARAKAELAAHQQPARYIAIDEFPRTANGKVQKVQLRELVVGKFQIGAGPLSRPRPAETSVA